MKKNTQKLKGSVFVLISAFFFGSYGMWSKLMAGNFGDFSQAWVRGLLLLIILIPFGIFTKKFMRVKKQDIFWFVLISLSGGINQAPYFYGFRHLSVGTATLLFYLMLTLGAFIIGKLFFGEVLTKVKYGSFALSAVGLFIIYRFTLSTDQILPALACMAAGLLGATFVAFSKKLSGNYSEIQILVYDIVAVVVCNLVFGWIFGEGLPLFHANVAWIALVGYSISFLLANATVIVGFKQLEPSIGGLLGLLEVVFAAIFGILFFHEVLSLQVILGS